MFIIKIILPYIYEQAYKGNCDNTELVFRYHNSNIWAVALVYKM